MAIRIIENIAMQKDQCLIFNNYTLNSTDGGPSGFLAQNVKGTTSKYYHFGMTSEKESVSFWQKFWFRHILREPARTARLLGLEKGSRFAGWLNQARTFFKRENAHLYKYIWFHDVWAMTACLDLIQSSQKIILQVHCPELPSEEASAQNYSSQDVIWTEQAQRRAFARADICVFPNSYSQSIYSPLISASTRVEYLASGCQKLEPEYKLPLDPSYIYYLYIGRRNKIKGFDIVLNAFRSAYLKDQRLQLLVVGGGERIEEPGIIDLGRSEAPGNWIAVADYLLSVNRNSYFDLSVMEALSIGTPLIIACTGGHRYFADISGPGIFPVSEASASELEDAILQNRTKRFNNAIAVNSNLRLFEENMSSQKYQHRLECFLRSLFSEDIDFSPR
jgi:glycosyltransferase involved in cell wall biosynthesis